MKVYRDIVSFLLYKVMSLSEVNRNNKELFFRIERKVLGNLAMNYEFETLADILFAFSKMN